MQLLCHLWRLCFQLRAVSVHRRQDRVACLSGSVGARLAGLLALGLVLPCAAQLSAQSAGTPAQTRMLLEVSKWVQQTQQLRPEQFSFAPMDARVQMQSCERALVMDLPFASRETVRVRCLGQGGWQLYVRLQFDQAQPAPLAAPASASSASSGAAATSRKVVVGKHLLRAGTLVSANLLSELEHSGHGLDSQAVSSVKDVENGELVRDVPAGTPLRSHDVRRAVLVKLGQTIVLSVSEPGGFAISARVEALQDGRLGDQVRLKNPDSGRILTGVVTGPNAARGL